MIDVQYHQRARRSLVAQIHKVSVPRFGRAVEEDCPAIALIALVYLRVHVCMQVDKKVRSSSSLVPTRVVTCQQWKTLPDRSSSGWPSRLTFGNSALARLAQSEEAVPTRWFLFTALDPRPWWREHGYRTLRYQTSHLASLLHYAGSTFRACQPGPLAHLARRRPCQQSMFSSTAATLSSCLDWPGCVQRRPFCVANAAANLLGSR